MIIGILIFSHPKDDRPTNADRLEEAGKAQGHTVVRFYEPFFSFIHQQDTVEVLYQNKPLGNVDVFIARPNFVEEPSLHTFMTDLLIRAGYRVINSQPTFSLSKNKLAQHVCLMDAGLPMPRWAIARTPEQAQDAVERIGFPVIIKTAFGTWGKGVFFADKMETFLPIVDYLAVRDGNPVIIESFIQEAGRKDLRVFIVGGRVIAAMERTARAGDVRANASIGGTGGSAALSKNETNLALAAANAFSLDIAGVDLIRSNHGPLVIEVNSNPGFRELERVTGTDIAGAIINYAVTTSDEKSA